MDPKHTVKSYDTELYKLRSTIAEMGTTAVSQLSLAFQALLNLNRDAAKEVVARDEKVDRLQASVDELTVLMLAKRQPLAQDLLVIKPSTVFQVLPPGAPAKQKEVRHRRIYQSGLVTAARKTVQIGL